MITAHLVDLVQQYQRIARSGLLNSRYDATRHGTHISTTVSTNLRFISYTAQGNTHVLAIHRLGNRTGNGGLTDTGRTNQT